MEKMSNPKRVLLFALILLIPSVRAFSTDNVCTFHVGGKLFSLVYLERDLPYKINVNDSSTIFFNFCAVFTPEQCSGSDLASAYSFQVDKIEQDDEIQPGPATNMSQNFQSAGEEAENITQGENETETEINDQINHQTVLAERNQCVRYSSNSNLYLFQQSYKKQQKLGTLKLILYTEKSQPLTSSGKRRYTQFLIECSDQDDFQIESYTVTDQRITIKGSSSSGCPVFSVSSIWVVFLDNQIFFGIIMIVLGLYMLFYGRVTLELTIFVGGFFISMAIFGSILTIFISPNSSGFAMYFAFLILLVLSTLCGYLVTRLVNISLFFVGAFLGFVIGMLVNSIFCKMTDIYSVWSLVVFEILFTIPFGILAFKYREEIIIASSSLTGAYLVIRPLSWLFGGFPNEFLLYHLIQTNELDSLPWSFFGYLILILVLAIIGAMYQLLKLYREHPNEQIEVNMIQQTVEGPADRVKEKIEGLIQRFKSDDGSREYQQLHEMRENASTPVRPNDNPNSKF